MAYRIVKTGGGQARIQLIPNKCKYLVAFATMCLEPVRLAPGAIYCEFHKHLENAGCAEHDKMGCKDPGCAPPKPLSAIEEAQLRWEIEQRRGQ